jgi:hypothetical protein
VGGHIRGDHREMRATAAAGDGVLPSWFPSQTAVAR